MPQNLKQRKNPSFISNILSTPEKDRKPTIRKINIIKLKQLERIENDTELREKLIRKLHSKNPPTKNLKSKEEYTNLLNELREESRKAKEESYRKHQERITKSLLETKKAFQALKEKRENNVTPGKESNIQNQISISIENHNRIPENNIDEMEVERFIENAISIINDANDLEQNTFDLQIQDNIFSDLHTILETPKEPWQTNSLEEVAVLEAPIQSFSCEQEQSAGIFNPIMMKAINEMLDNNILEDKNFFEENILNLGEQENDLQFESLTYEQEIIYEGELNKSPINLLNLGIRPLSNLDDLRSYGSKIEVRGAEPFVRGNENVGVLFKR